jgi:hypothetical protein
MYKRNQLETAIGALMEGSSGAASDELRTKLKRLLETDRAFGDEPRSARVKHDYAFFGGAPPGRGVEVWFSAYEAFALLMGLQLMQHGWSQTFAVALLRDARSDLEKAHGAILQLDQDKLFDKEAIRKMARAGDPAFDTTAPQLLVIIMQHGVELGKQNRPFKTSVQADTGSAMKWVATETKGVGVGAAIFELTVSAFRLQAELERSAPKPRGRAS